MSPDLSPMCVSPGSFYDGVSSPETAQSSAEDNKENQDPSLLGKPNELAEAAPAASAASATSKHFGGNRGAISSAPSGLRRRFRRPLALVSVSSSNTSATTGIGACSSGGGGGRVGDRDYNPWGAEHTYSRLDVKPESGGLAAAGGAGRGGGGDGGGGTSGVTGGAGSRLKRRRTLGLGSVASKGLTRVLDGGMLGRGGGGGGTGPRSKSLGGKIYFADDAANLLFFSLRIRVM